MMTMLALAAIGWCGSAVAADIVHESLVSTDGWAQNSLNATSFRHSSVTSRDGWQFIAFVDGDERVVLGKRQLGTDTWQIHITQYTVDATDAHNGVTIGIDGNGYLHVAWNHHNDPLHYARSTTPSGLQLTSPQGMIGSNEQSVTYPQFFNLPDGRMLFMYRDGASGDGDMVLNRYDPSTTQWTRLHTVLIDGEGQRNAYWQAAVDINGRVHLSWVWRENPDVESNHDMGYARSDDGGQTWTKSNGVPYSLPITASNSEYAMLIPQNRELINQTGMAGDGAGRPYIVTYFREASSNVPQYWLIYHDGTSWHTQQVGERTLPFTLSGGGTQRIPISRPQVAVTDGDGLVVHMAFRDEERGFKVSLATSDDLASGSWNIRDLTDYSVDMWEPTFDRALWKAQEELHLYLQQVEQLDDEGQGSLDPTPVSVLEWVEGGDCGDGTPDAGEDCDDGNTADGDCCSSTCQYEASGSPCGDSGDTVCDDPDTCDGAGNCQANYEPSTTECRATAGACDVAENCDGAGACPTDVFEPPTTECRADAGECDVAENCTGGSASCPPDGFEPSGTACGDPGDTLCDDPDSCDGGGICQANYEPVTTECRAAAGLCDIAENCDGAGGCPADVVEPPTTECRADAGECDIAENCDGASPTCPANIGDPPGTACGDPGDTVCDDPDTCDGAGSCQPNWEPPTTECRAAVGVCDAPDHCDGASAGCPPDAKLTTECRASAGVCDPPEMCDGVADDCPADAFEPGISGTILEDGSSPVEDVSLSADNGGGSDTTDAFGQYDVCVPDAWSGTITPTKTDYTFVPTSRSYVDVSSDITNEDYTAEYVGVAAVEIIGSWTTGISHAAESGSNRALIFTAHHQDNESAGSYLTSVTYGGQALDPIAESEYYTDPYHYYVTAWILDEAGIAAAFDGNFAVTWSDGGPSNTPGYSSVFLENVDQAYPIGDSATANCDCEILSTAALATSASDMVLLAASHGGNSASSTDYACLNGFTEALEFYDPPISGEGMGGYKAASGADETPSVDSQNTNYSGRQALLGFVVQAGAGGDCGDGDIDAGEQCDDGNTLDGDCCSSTCQYEASGSPCGDPGDTVCDDPDTCDGAGNCEANPEPPTTECRAAVGSCDIAESCDGAGSCPADGYEPPTTECRADAGECDIAENCSGGSPTCPTDVGDPPGTPCGDPSDTMCDNPDTCDGAGSCQPNLEPPTTECRPSAHGCDPAELCDGVNPTCPEDSWEPGTAECRAAAGVCDAPEYDCPPVVATCPPDAKLPSTTVCRPSVQVCDASEYCDGVSDDCGFDLPANGLPCPDGDLCNGDEVCVGWVCTPGMPPNCDDDDICTADSCDPSGACVHVPVYPIGSTCRRPDLPSASPAGRLLLSLLLIGAGAAFLARRRRYGV